MVANGEREYFVLGIGARFKHHKGAQLAPHVTKLNIALETGLPLGQWVHGLTGLLEKEFGAIYLDKLRATCLIEADFSWFQKLIFSPVSIYILMYFVSKCLIYLYQYS